jgi:hypothetical protein
MFCDVEKNEKKKLGNGYIFLFAEKVLDHTYYIQYIIEKYNGQLIDMCI